MVAFERPQLEDPGEPPAVAAGIAVAAGLFAVLALLIEQGVFSQTAPERPALPAPSLVLGVVASLGAAAALRTRRASAAPGAILVVAYWIVFLGALWR